MSLLVDPPTGKEWLYACEVLGRALYIASGFEDDCRSLAFVVKIRDPQLDAQSDDEFYNAFVKAVLGRLVDLNKLIVGRAKLQGNYADMLHAARDARNYIAHEAVAEFEKLAKLPEGVGRWQDLMESKLEDICYGKVIVAVLLSRNSAEPTPTKETIDAYPGKITSWVLQNETAP